MLVKTLEIINYCKSINLLFYNCDRKGQGYKHQEMAKVYAAFQVQLASQVDFGVAKIDFLK
jgi:hypothetical protein